MTERSLVRTLVEESVFCEPFIWIKAWIKQLETSIVASAVICNGAKGRVDIDK